MGHKALVAGLAAAALFCVIPAATHAATLSKPGNSLGLVGYWTFDEGVGNSASDHSGNGNNGTLTAGTTLPTWVPGRHDKALNFDGNGGYVSTPSSAPLNLNASMSAGAWVKLSDVTNYRMIISKESTAGPPWPYRLYVAQTSGQVVYDFTVSSVQKNVTTTLAINDNKWHYVLAVRDDSAKTMTIYIDGAVRTSGSYTGTPDTGAQNARIGISPYTGQGAGGSYPFLGSIDDVRIYNRALSAAEVSNLYKSGIAQVNSTQTSVTSGLAGWFTMDGADTAWTSPSAATAADKSGTGNAMTLTNMSQSSAPVPGKIGQALRFDGVDDYLRRPTLTASLLTQTTVCMWIKAANLGQDQVLWSIDRNAGSIVNEAIFKILANGQLRYWDYTGAAYGFADGIPDSSAAVADNTWHHVCFTKDGTAGTFYIDGTSSGTKTAGVSVSYGTTDMIVGSDYRGSSAYFKGLIDDVRVYTRALSASEIKQVYNEGVGGKVNVDNASGSLLSGLVGYWPFNGADVTDKIYDRSGNNNNGYVGGGAATSSMKTIGKVGQALSFNGANGYIATGYTIPAQSSATSFTWSSWAKLNPGNTCCRVLLGFRTGATWVKLTPASFEYSGGIITYAIPTGSWVHLAVVKDGSSFTYYANGAVVGTASNSSSVISNTFYIGEDPGTPSDGVLSGSLDEVRVYNRALSASEVKQLYLAGK